MTRFSSRQLSSRELATVRPTVSAMCRSRSSREHSGRGRRPARRNRPLHRDSSSSTCRGLIQRLRAKPGAERGTLLDGLITGPSARNGFGHPLVPMAVTFRRNALGGRLAERAPELLGLLEADRRAGHQGV